MSCVLASAFALSWEPRYGLPENGIAFPLPGAGKGGYRRALAGSLMKQNRSVLMMKSIRRKITTCLIATVLIALLTVGAFSMVLNYRSTLSTVEQMCPWRKSARL